VLVGFAKVTRDLTERRLSEQRALADARRMASEETARRAAEEREHAMQGLVERADEANRVKSQFLAAISHELRTPLNAIGGYADLMAMGLSGPLTPQQEQQLGRIKRSQTHLLGIINDILNFSRIEAGQLVYDITDVPVRDAIDAVMHMVMPQAVTNGVLLQVEECPEGAVARADRPKLEQILINLLTNAVKFTPAGGRIALVCVEQDDRVTVTVRDTGPGIPPEMLEAIFEPFVQVGRSLTAPAEGTGLGLAISRDLARAMGGDITVESSVGDGSRFTVTLPPAARTTRSPR
jgi:signal transduction histidine kinase